MKRDEYISRMMDKAREITGTNSDKWTRDAENEIWEMCSKWNSEHYGGCYDEAEIFMCEMSKADGDDRDGFMIEDDIFEYVE